MPQASNNPAEVWVSNALWTDPFVVRCIAFAAVAFLVVTVLLFRRRQRRGNAAAIICLVLSVGLHAILIFMVPQWVEVISGGGPIAEAKPEAGERDVQLTLFDPQLMQTDTLGASPDFDDVASHSDDQAVTEIPDSIAPLPIDVLASDGPSETTDPPEQVEANDDPPAPESPVAAIAMAAVPSSLTGSPLKNTTDLETGLDDWLSQVLQDPEQHNTREDVPALKPDDHQATMPEQQAITHVPAPAKQAVAASRKQSGAPSRAIGEVNEDFASRTGRAKQQALLRNGGDADTEAAVAAALRYLASQQAGDGSWKPLANGGGIDRKPLGLRRGDAGRRDETGITGLALLAMIGAGHTHQDGEHQQSVYNGLSYLLQQQRTDGSLAGSASTYSAHYCHAMAGLALAEVAAMTGDAVARQATQNAVAYTKSMQHLTTGGWRYTRGDPGDLSQLGWQAMLIDAAQRSGAIDRPTRTLAGIRRFLSSVQAGRSGGLACYRPGERPTMPMTAEALAIRWMIGDRVPTATQREAETMLLRHLPGSGPYGQVELGASTGGLRGTDNLYAWYYATLALHQSQGPAWDRWNAALKKRLLSAQQADGAWSNRSLWGGYGGTVYTTSMAALCLESYYRHALRQDDAVMVSQPPQAADAEFPAKF
ncbi:MAG: prenyltransferase/squalene oxidase repeat-containing protein [Planctomycetota bacterium]